ncbi:MAG TPA: hypothetical protein PLS58_13450 [Bacteroidales bacterium]|nr:hypothetical protein [Bacteroidales bacterium]
MRRITITSGETGGPVSPQAVQLRRSWTLNTGNSLPLHSSLAETCTERASVNRYLLRMRRITITSGETGGLAPPGCSAPQELDNTNDGNSPPPGRYPRCQATFTQS